MDTRLAARVSLDPVLDPGKRTQTVYVPPASVQVADWDDLHGYRALLTNSRECDIARFGKTICIPAILGIEIEHLRTGDVVLLGRDGYIRTAYRPDSSFNTLFATDRCNSNCLMCSQPPKDIDDSYRIDDNLEVVKLIEPSPRYLGITGGEPTLLGEGLFRQLRALRDTHPSTDVHLLTNGRRFAWLDFTRAFSEIQHPRLSVGIPRGLVKRCVNEFRRQPHVST